MVKAVLGHGLLYFIVIFWVLFLSRKAQGTQTSITDETDTFVS